MALILGNAAAEEMPETESDGDHHQDRHQTEQTGIRSNPPLPSHPLASFACLACLATFATFATFANFANFASP
jgi:hypothetical protein